MTAHEPYAYKSFGPVEKGHVNPASSAHPDSAKSAEFFDSGYSSVTSLKRERSVESQLPGIDGEEIGKRRILPPKPAKLKPFDLPIPRTYTDRFADLLELFNDELRKHLSGTKGQNGPLSIKLKMLGECRETAKPFVVVFCSKAISKRVRHFFKRSVVREEYQPNSAKGNNMPFFGILVSELPPQLLVRTRLLGSIISRPDAQYMDQTSVQFFIDSNHGGTLSSPVHITRDDKSYAFTCAHVLRSAERGMPTSATDRLFNEDVDSEEDDSESATSTDSSGDEFTAELDPSVIDGTAGTKSYVAHFTNIFEQIKTHSREYLGESYISSDEGAVDNDRPDSDWTIISSPGYMNHLKNITRNRWSIGDRHEKAMATAMSDTILLSSKAQAMESQVYILTGGRGSLLGKLNNAPCRFTPSPGRRTVRTYGVTLSSSNQRLLPGDSGSWVVDVTSGRVYGHLIAVDAFGEGYVVSLQGTFIDIQDRVGCPVRLSTSADILGYGDRLDVETLPELTSRDAPLGKTDKEDTNVSKRQTGFKSPKELKGRKDVQPVPRRAGFGARLYNDGEESDTSF